MSVVATPAPAHSSENGPPSAPSGAPEPPQRSKFLLWLDQFWQRVTEGLELSQLWKQFQTDAKASYRLYRRDFDAHAPEDKRHHFLHTAQELVWAILEKLSPARRVLLLAAVVLLLFGRAQFYFRDQSGHAGGLGFDFQFLAGALLLLLLMLEIADRVVMKRDLQIARDIQGWLLPSTPPRVPGLALAFATRAANTVAGDFYDVFARAGEAAEDERFLLAVADVAGKSIPAALLMATFQASLRTLSMTPCSLPQLAANMNRYACSNSQGGLRFTTAFLAEYKPSNRDLTYINAGHNHPILLRGSGSIERLASGGLPLGIQADAIYASGSTMLQPGDWLVVFTDGVVEAENSAQQEYGEDRLLEVLHSGSALAPDEMLRRIMASLDSFVGTTAQHDDITCLAVKAG